MSTSRPLRPGGKSPIALRVHCGLPGEGFDVTEAGTQKRLAVWVVRDVADVDRIASLGPDAMAVTRDELAEILRGTSGRIKNVLTDQRVIAGIGNAYSDEILHTAKLSPFASSKTLSDGQIDTYVENEYLDSSLPLHAMRSGETYRLGFFLVGAYQEILGDIHNLFGDTDTVAVRLDGQGGYSLATQRRGDTTDVMLDYVGYKLEDLWSAYRTRVEEAKLPADEAVALSEALEAGLTGYTYLSDEPLG